MKLFKKSSKTPPPSGDRFAEDRMMLGAEEEIEVAIARSVVQEKRVKIRKKKFRLALWAGGGVVVALLGYYLFAPFQGTMAYGVCKVFLEQRVQFPMHLRLSQVEQSPTNLHLGQGDKFSSWVRIWYTQLDGFGAYRLEPIQCYFHDDPELGYTALEKVTIRRREIDPEIVKSFNKTIPIIFEHPPDLTMPTPLPDKLKNLRFEINRFIKPIL
jgi:hypothetical protein